MTRREHRQTRLQKEYGESLENLKKATASDNYSEAALICDEMVVTARALARIFEINLRIYHNRCAGQQSRRRLERKWRAEAHERNRTTAA